jgi:hypothetical protein
VMVYVPAVVPGLPPPPPSPLLPPLPQARMPPLRVTISASNPSIVCHLRRCVGMPKIRMQAKVAPLTAYQAALGRLRSSIALRVVAVVVTVSVAVSRLGPAMVSGVVVPKLKVGRSKAPEGLAVRTAVRATLPVNPTAGITVIVEVLFVVAPGATVTAEPLTAKLGFTAVTVTGAWPVAPAYVEELLESGV